MPKARTKEVKPIPCTVEERKYYWKVSFQERQAFLTCPVCNNTINFDIVETPKYCERCRTKLAGIVNG